MGLATPSLRQRFLDYLDAYAAKDLGRVSGMLADDVALRDWNISVRGKAEAVAQTAANFAGARSIGIEVLGLLEGGLEVPAPAGRVAGELRILVDGMIELRVVDVLDFDAEGRIVAIRAYLGRAA
jgi:steroid delta-isomerase